MNWINDSRLTMVGTAAALLLCGSPDVAAQDIRNERLKILADDGAEFNYFGTSVAISGPTAIVGATGNDVNGTNSGSAYLFDVATGTQIAKLLASDGTAGDRFGGSVGISGGSAIVGARWHDVNGNCSGSGYLFDVATGIQIAKLLPSDPLPLAEFGSSVAICGSTCIVGAERDWHIEHYGGSAYLFETTSGMQIAKLVASDGAREDYFGTAVAISGSTALVGSPGDDDNGSRSGSAYLFDATTGRQIAKLLPIDGVAYGRFGASVAISASTAIVGAPDSENWVPYFNECGLAYLFDVATGTQIARLLPSDVNHNDHFGVSVAISGSTSIVGANGDDDKGRDSGSAYLFDAATGEQIAKLLPSDGAERDDFGSSVAISGSTAIVGAPQADDNGTDSGSAYIFDASGITPPIFTLEFSGDCPGMGAFTVTSATPNGNVAIVYGFGDGPTTIPVTLPCAGTVLDVGNPNLGNRTIRADANGVAVLNTKLPAAACDQLRVQAIDVATCETSEVVRP